MTSRFISGRKELRTEQYFSRALPEQKVVLLQDDNLPKLFLTNSSVSLAMPGALFRVARVTFRGPAGLSFFQGCIRGKKLCVHEVPGKDMDALREFCITGEKWFASGDGKIFRISSN